MGTIYSHLKILVHHMDGVGKEDTQILGHLRAPWQRMAARSRGWEGRDRGVHVGWPVGWLAGLVAGWLVGWLAGWLAGSLAGWLTGWLWLAVADWRAV